MVNSGVLDIGLRVRTFLELKEALIKASRAKKTRTCKETPYGAMTIFAPPSAPRSW